MLTEVEKGNSLCREDDNAKTVGEIKEHMGKVLMEKANLHLGIIL